MSSLSELYDRLVKLLAANKSSDQQHQDSDSDTVHVENAISDVEEQEKLENLRAAYHTLQQLAKELKPTIDNFFDSLSNDAVPTSNDEACFKAMNSKLDVFLAFCPGIRVAYNLEKDARCSDKSGA